MKNTVKTMRAKGFTLIEVIIVVGIIGVLASILVPTIRTYVLESQKKADIANAKEIWSYVNEILATNNEVSDAFFSTEAAWFFSANDDGSMNTYAVKPKWNGSKNYNGDYALGVVARMDGARPDYENKSLQYGNGNINGPYYVWNPTDIGGGNDYSNSKAYKLFATALNKAMGFPNYDTAEGKKDPGLGSYRCKLQYHLRHDGKTLKPSRWLVCYRFGDKEHIEIWVGDGSKAKNGSMYRLFPRPHESYSNGANAADTNGTT